LYHDLCIISREWPPETAGSHIFVKEVAAVEIAIEGIRRIFTHHELVVLTDNTACVGPATNGVHDYHCDGARDPRRQCSVKGTEPTTYCSDHFVGEPYR
jgi:hypothetical protein